MAKSKIKFAKALDVKDPTRANAEDAGIDFYVPRFTSNFIKKLIEKNPVLFKTKDDLTLTSGGCITLSNSSSGTYVSNSNQELKFNLNDQNSGLFKYDEETGLPYFLLPPLSGVNIPSGIYCKMGPDRMLLALNKSGVATKDQLVVGACLVDSSYQGEIHIHVMNLSSKVVRIYEDKKLVQFAEVPIILSDIDVEQMGPTFGDLQKFFEVKSSRGASGFGDSDHK